MYFLKSGSVLLNLIFVFSFAILCVWVCVCVCVCVSKSVSVCGFILKVLRKFENEIEFLLM